MAVTIKCKCGKSSEYYRYLSDTDFPDGLIKDCCSLPVEVAPTPPTTDGLFPALKAGELDALVEKVAEVVEEDQPKPFRKYKRAGK